MNSTRKGNRTVRQGTAWLSDNGWRVGQVDRPKRMRSKGNVDLFGLFDAIAVRGKQTLFVQFTTNRPHTHKKYIEWSLDHGPAVQLVWYDRKGFKIFWYMDGNKTVEDLRK